MYWIYTVFIFNFPVNLHSLQVALVLTIPYSQQFLTRIFTAMSSRIRAFSPTWKPGVKVSSSTNKNINILITFQRWAFCCRLALLRHWWPTSVLPVSKWHTIFTSRLRVRLVVQRALWSLATSLRHQCTTLSTPQGESDTPTSHHYEGASWWYLQLSWTVRQQRL